MTLQQDNARPHKSRKTLDYLNEKGWSVVKWPPNSCDFSPIEFVWALMTAEIDRNWKPNTLKQLQTAIEIVWPQVTSHNVLQQC